MTFWFLIFAAVLGGAAYWWSEQAKLRRLNEMETVGRALGLTFHAQGPNNQRFTQFKCFDQGYARRGEGTIEGAFDVDERRYALRMGDFCYKRSTQTMGGPRRRHGEQEREIRFSYAMLETAWGHMPSFRIRPEGVLDKVVGAVGLPDINFESEEFSRAFHVSGPDRRFVYDLVTPPLMEKMLRAPRKWDLRCEGGVLMLEGSSLWSTERLSEAAVFLRSIVRSFPAHVISDLEGGSSIEVAQEALESTASPAAERSPDAGADGTFGGFLMGGHGGGLPGIPTGRGILPGLASGPVQEPVQRPD